MRGSVNAARATCTDSGTRRICRVHLHRARADSAGRRCYYLGRRGTWSAVSRARAGRFRQGVAPGVTADRRRAHPAVDSAIGAAFTGITMRVAAVGGRPRRGRGIHPRSPAAVHSGFCYILTRNITIVTCFQRGHIRLTIRRRSTLDIRTPGQITHGTLRPIIAPKHRTVRTSINATTGIKCPLITCTNNRGIVFAIFFLIKDCASGLNKTRPLVYMQGRPTHGVCGMGGADTCKQHNQQ